MSDATFDSEKMPLFEGLVGRKLHAAWANWDRERTQERMRANGQSSTHGAAVTANGTPRLYKHRGQYWDGVRIK